MIEICKPILPALNLCLEGAHRLLRKHLTPELQKQTYHGFAFEKYCQSSKLPEACGSVSAEPPSIDMGVHVDSAEWCTVVRTTLGDMSMIVGAEIDCIKGKLHHLLLTLVLVLFCI